MPIVIQIGQGQAAETHKGMRPIFLHHRESPKDCNSNSRKMEIISWEWFVRRNGLYQLFFGSDGLMVFSPGIFPLYPNHLKAVEDSLKRFENANPHLVDADHEADVDVSALDYERLQWLCYWIKWALNNCGNPVIWNSQTT